MVPRPTARRSPRASARAPAGVPVLVGLTCTLLLGAMTACDRRRARECPRFEPVHRLPAAGTDPIVAEVDGRPVTSSQIAARAAEQGLELRAALDSLVEEELLVQEAERLGLHRDPEAVHAAKQAAIYALLRRGFERDFTAAKVPEEDLRRLYRLNERTHFRRPELRRFSHVFSPRPWQKRGRTWTLDGERDQRLRAVFEALHADIAAAKPETWQEFEALATKERGQGFPLEAQRGTLPKVELQQPFADALFDLKSPGQITGVLATKRFMHVAFLVEIVPATHVSFQEARESILSRHFPDARRKAFEELVKEARERCTIRVRPEHLPVAE